MLESNVIFDDPVPNSVVENQKCNRSLKFIFEKMEKNTRLVNFFINNYVIRLFKISQRDASVTDQAVLLNALNVCIKETKLKYPDSFFSVFFTEYQKEILEKTVILINFIK
jgi:tRNA A-37 threonylcarbamoyl transferase component Bud32